MSAKQEAELSSKQDMKALKLIAAEKALEFVESGMVLGLGGGSTVLIMVNRLAELINNERLQNIQAVPCCRETRDFALNLGIPLTDLDTHPKVDLTIDGADEVDPQLDLIKGGGGMLLREKIIAQASQRVMIIVDESKLSPQLGTKWALPLEVTPFGLSTQKEFLESLGSRPELRVTPDGSLYHTEQGNLILDCDFGPITDPLSLAAHLEKRAGIVEHGLFINLATDLIVAGKMGCRHIQRGES